MITLVPRLIFIWCATTLILIDLIGQQVIPELTIDFDGTEPVSILSANDTDNNPGFFGIRNGSFEINDMEGTPCINTSTDGFNDNLALVLSDVALSNYCNVSIEIITRISNADFEECLSPGSLNPIGCTDFGVSEPGADGLIISVAGLGGDLVTAGYCGSDRIGTFSVSGLDIMIGDLITVSITGGTQAVDEFYYIDQILVQGIPESPIPPQIIGDTEYCANQDAIVLNVIPQGGSNYRWFKDDITLNNDDNELYVKALPDMTDAGIYRVEFDLPSGCPTSTSVDIEINDCSIDAPIFNLVQTYCSNESLVLSSLSDNNISGSWNVPTDLDLSNSGDELIVEFTPDNGGLQFVDTLSIFRSYSDVLTIPLCPQNFFEINGNTYTVADVGQTREERFNSADGCDSIIYVEIVQIPGDYVIIDDTYCIDDTIVINNMSYYLGESFGRDTFISEIGCDSIVEVDLIFRVPEESNVFGFLCPDDVLDISGEIYDINRPDGTLVLTTLDGCDSIVNIDLSFIETDSLSIEVALCPGDSQTVMGIEIDRDFDPNLYFNFGPNGCDTLINFIVNPIEPVQTFISGPICPNEVLVINGSRYDENSLLGAEVFEGSNGCDSIVNIDLQVRDLDTTFITGFYCESQNYSTTVSGVVYDNSNPFGQEVLIDKNGCDSVVSIDLIIQPILTGEESYNGCQGDGYELILNGVVYNQDRPQGSEVLFSNQGCDSIVTVSLDFLPNNTDTISYLGCQGDGYSIIVDGLIYDELIPRGEQRLINGFGCDSIITVDLIFAPPVISEVNYTGCLGDGVSVEVAGNLYDELNPTGTETLVSSSGCDSIVQVELTYNTSSRSEETYIGCQDDGYSITVNGTLYNESKSVGQEVLTNAAGCDSIVDISLQFAMISTDTIKYLGCSGDGFELIVGGNSYDEITPNGSERLLSASGCDSIVAIELTYLEPVVNDLLYEGCVGDGYFVEVNDQRYDEMNPFGVESLLGSNGCDSVIMIDFIYESLDTAYLNDIICARNGTSRFINGTVYDKDNPTGVEVFTSAEGCDSVVVVDLEFTEAITFDLNDTLCFGTSIIVDGNTYDANNPIGSERILLANGCDSIINVSLSFVDPIEFTFSIDTLIQNESYQLEIIEVPLIETIIWTSPGLDCMDCTDPVLTTNENTTVSVQVNDIYGCSSLIELPVILDQSLPNIYVPNAISPNSAMGNNKIRPVLPQGVSATYDLMIYDRWGGIIYRELRTDVNNTDSGWDGRFNSEQVSQGVYIYSMTIYVPGLDQIEMTGSVTVF